MAGWAWHDAADVGALIVLPAVVAVGVALRWPGPERRWWVVPVTPLALGAAAVLSLAATLAYPGPVTNRTGVWWIVETAGLLALLALAARQEPPARAVPAAVGLLLATAALPVRLGSRMDPPADAAELAVLSTVWGIGGLTAVAAGGYLRWLDARRSRAVARARRAQRLVLARHVHDFVAHEVSGMVVQSQAGLLLGERDPRHALNALRRVEDAGQRALTSLDHAVLLLEDDTSWEGRGPAPAKPGLDALEELVARFRSEGTRRVTLERDAAVADPGLPPLVSLAAYRVVLEGLTNVRRHAPGARAVTVTARREGGCLVVGVTDDGSAAGADGPPPRPGSGSGLVDLGLRVEALGGALTAEAREEGGWRVRARFPRAWSS